MENNQQPEVPLQIIYQAWNKPTTLRLKITTYGKRFIASYIQVNEKGEEVHLFMYKTGNDEEYCKQELYKNTLHAIAKFAKTNTSG